MSNPPTQAPIAAPSSHGCTSPIGAARGEPAADRRDRHREREKELGVAGEPLRERVPEHDRERDRRQREADAARAGTTAPTNATDETTTMTVASRRLIAPRGISRIAVRGFLRVPLRVHEAVEPHRRRPRRDHRDDDPEHAPGRSSRGRQRGWLLQGQQRARQRKRQREHAVAEAHERQVGLKAVHVVRDLAPLRSPVTVAIQKSDPTPVSSGGVRDRANVRSAGSMPLTRYSSTSATSGG